MTHRDIGIVLLYLTSAMVVVPIIYCIILKFLFEKRGFSKLIFVIILILYTLVLLAIATVIWHMLINKF